MARQRHPRKELEALLSALEAHGWRVERSKGYFRIYCWCRSTTHMRSVALTPSGSRYEANLRAWLRRTGHWED